MTTISGILTDGTGQIINNCTIELYAKKTTSSVLTQTQAFRVAENGKYSMTVLPCDYDVNLVINGFPKKRLGTIQVFSDSVDGTLNDYLLNPAESEITPAILQQVLDARNDAKQSANNAGLSAKNSKTSETNAEKSSKNAKTSETNSVSSAKLASESATIANNASQSAKNSESSAKTSADNAAKFADSASQSAKNAGNSATSAKTAETGALTSATEAKQSALDAKNWASTVDTSTFVKKSGDTMTGDFTINGKSVLTVGDGGLLSKAPLLPAGTDLLSDFVLSASQTFTLAGNYINSPIKGITGTLIVTRRLFDAGAAATLEINQSNNKYYKSTAQKSIDSWVSGGWVEQITTANASADIVGALPAVKAGENNAPIYKVGNQVDFSQTPTVNGQSVITDVSAIQNKLNEIDNRTYIVESYQNGDSWYRVYSNGFIEQSGTINIKTTAVNSVCGTFINLLKPTKTKNYGVSIDKFNSGPWAQTEYAQAESYTTAFWLASYSSIAGECWVRWTARGY